MIDKPDSRLRQRMIEDMTSRRFTEKVQKDYLRHARNFAVFFGRSPDAARSEDVRLFQLHMAEQKIGAPTINAQIEHCSLSRVQDSGVVIPPGKARRPPATAARRL
jgi:integrase/recombinase XerD